MMEGLMPLGRGGTMLMGGKEVLHILFSGLNKHRVLAIDHTVGPYPKTDRHLRGG